MVDKPKKGGFFAEIAEKIVKRAQKKADTGHKVTPFDQLQDAATHLEISRRDALEHYTGDAPEASESQEELATEIFKSSNLTDAFRKQAQAILSETAQEFRDSDWSNKKAQLCKWPADVQLLAVRPLYDEKDANYEQRLRNAHWGANSNPHTVVKDNSFTAGTAKIEAQQQENDDIAAMREPAMKALILQTCSKSTKPVDKPVHVSSDDVTAPLPSQAHKKSGFDGPPM